METFCHFSENGRVEGLILDKRTPDGAKRPRSAKGDRRFALDGRMTRTMPDMPTRQPAPRAAHKDHLARNCCSNNDDIFKT